MLFKFFLCICILTSTLQNGNYKCLTCHSGGRGKSAPKKGGSLRGDPNQSNNFLDCGCPENAALLELWLAKATAGLSGVPERPPAGSKSTEGSADLKVTKADFAMNPVLLEIIAAAIELLTGLQVDDLFTRPQVRLENTVRYALEELAQMSPQALGPERLQHFDRLCDAFNRFSADPSVAISRT